MRIFAEIPPDHPKPKCTLEELPVVLQKRLKVSVGMKPSNRTSVSDTLYFSAGADEKTCVEAVRLLGFKATVLTEPSHYFTRATDRSHPPTED